MKYKGIELKEFTSDKPVVFDPPKKMLVWDHTYDKPMEAVVLAYLPGIRYPAITEATKYAYCAKIPETPKPRRATNCELAKWLAEGNGENLNRRSNIVHHEYSYSFGYHNEPVPPTHVIRKWDDEEWHEPTADYMGLVKGGQE